MTEEQHARLRALAEAAKQSKSPHWWTERQLNGQLLCGYDDAAYIAAVSPDVLLALLDALADATRERDEANQRAKVEHGYRKVAERERDEARVLCTAERGRADALAAELEHAKATIGLAASFIPAARFEEFVNRRAALRREGGNGDEYEAAIEAGSGIRKPGESVADATQRLKREREWREGGNGG